MNPRHLAHYIQTDDDAWYMLMAVIAGCRSKALSPYGSCAAVGCVLVSNETKQIVSIGFNGGPSGGDDKQAKSLHAEQNALWRIGESKEEKKALTAYVTLIPCGTCVPLLHQENVVSVVYLSYSSAYSNSIREFQSRNIEFRPIQNRPRFIDALSFIGTIVSKIPKSLERCCPLELPSTPPLTLNRQDWYMLFALGAATKSANQLTGFCLVDPQDKEEGVNTRLVFGWEPETKQLLNSIPRTPANNLTRRLYSVLLPDKSTNPSHLAQLKCKDVYILDEAEDKKRVDTNKFQAHKRNITGAKITIKLLQPSNMFWQAPVRFWDIYQTRESDEQLDYNTFPSTLSPTAPIARKKPSARCHDNSACVQRSIGACCALFIILLLVFGFLFWPRRAPNEQFADAIPQLTPSSSIEL